MIFVLVYALVTAVLLVAAYLAGERMERRRRCDAYMEGVADANEAWFQSENSAACKRSSDTEGDA